MRILGLDPGSRFTGYGVLERQGRRLKAVDMGRIALPAKAPLPSRLLKLSQEVARLIAQHEPDFAVLESLYHGVNPRSLIVLAQARGCLLTTLASNGLEICEYAPAEIKTAVTGNGRADKEQVARMVRLVLGLGEQKLSPDASDALAVAICFSQRYRFDRLGSAEARRRRPAN